MAAAGAGEEHRRFRRLRGSPRDRRPGKSRVIAGTKAGARAPGRQSTAMSRGLQLLLLSCGRACGRPAPPARLPATPSSRLLTQLSLPLAACSLAPAAREVKVVCSEDVDLPCTAPWDPQVTYTVSWAKVSAARLAG